MTLTGLGRSWGEGRAVSVRGPHLGLEEPGAPGTQGSQEGAVASLSFLPAHLRGCGATRCTELAKCSWDKNAPSAALAGAAQWIER